MAWRAGSQLALSALLAGLRESSLTISLTSYASLRGVCSSWRRALDASMCPRTPSAALDEERLWTAPFALRLQGPMRVERLWQLLDLSSMGHEVDTLHVGGAGQVGLLQRARRAGVLLLQACCLCSPGAARLQDPPGCHRAAAMRSQARRQTSAAAQLFDGMPEAESQQGCGVPGHLSSCPPIRGLRRLVLHVVDAAAALDLGALDELQVLCLQVPGNNYYLTGPDLLQVLQIPRLAGQSLSVVGLAIQNEWLRNLSTVQYASGLQLTHFCVHGPSLAYQDLHSYAYLTESVHRLNHLHPQGVDFRLYGPSWSRPGNDPHACPSFEAFCKACFELAEGHQPASWVLWDHARCSARAVLHT